MKITELDDGESEGKGIVSRREIIRADAKKALVGAGARILFYPTLLYNVFRNKIEAEFRWWDEVDQEHGIEHLVIPTRDYLFAPSVLDISRAVDFIHKNASCGRTTYVHCKAGRGRSTTIVLCYLIKYKHMTPTGALEYVQTRRPRVLLAPSQWKAVQEYGKCQSNYHGIQSSLQASSPSIDEVLITEADLEGYGMHNNACKEFSTTCNTVQARSMIVRLSYLLASLKASCVSYPVSGKLVRAC